MAGTMVGNRWRLDQRLTRGAEGETFRATDLLTNGAATLKLAPPGGGAKLRREHDILRQLDHPAALRAFDLGETSNHSIFLALDYVEGRTLTQVLVEDGPLPPARASALADHLAGALDAAHALGIVHRDLAPEHILCHRDAAGQEAWKLLDFGMAKASRLDIDVSPRDTDANLAAPPGSTRYASPEAAAGKALTPASDIYSLGAALYEALTGVPPFDGENDAALAMAHLRDEPPGFAQANPELAFPAGVESAVLAALDKRPNRRPASAGELATRLRLAAGRPAQDIAMPAAPGAPNRFLRTEMPMDRPLSIRERVQTPQRPHLVPGEALAAAPGSRPQREKSNTVSWDNVAAAAAPPEDIVLKVKLSHAIIALLAVVACTGMAILVLRGG